MLRPELSSQIMIRLETWFYFGVHRDSKWSLWQFPYLIRHNYDLYSYNNILHERMESERVPKQLIDYILRGTGSSGRPNLRWTDQPVSHKNGTDRKVQTLTLFIISRCRWITNPNITVKNR
jgi:hypothetical protein